jgi:hypothetical protein
MTSFKQFFLEYKHKNPLLSTPLTGVDPNNGKKIHRAHLRKHSNTLPKPPTTKVGKYHAGQRLHDPALAKLLADYNIKFEAPLAKGLGSSTLEVVMGWEGKNRVGILRLRQNQKAPKSITSNVSKLI